MRTLGLPALTAAIAVTLTACACWLGDDYKIRLHIAAADKINVSEDGQSHFVDVYVFQLDDQQQYDKFLSDADEVKQELWDGKLDGRSPLGRERDGDRRGPSGSSMTNPTLLTLKGGELRWATFRVTCDAAYLGVVGRFRDDVSRLAVDLRILPQRQVRIGEASLSLEERVPSQW
jgi:hypothetical protein